MHFLKLHNKCKYIWLFILFCLAIIIFYWYQTDHIKIQNNIYSLLPQEIFPKEINQVSTEMMQKLNSKLWVVLEASDQKNLEKATSYFKKSISKSQYFTEIFFPDFNLVFQILFKHRGSILTENDRGLLLRKNYQGIIDESLLKLYTPGLVLSHDILANDPFLMMSTFITELSKWQSSSYQQISILNGYPTILQNGSWYRLLMLRVNGNPMDISFQHSVSPWMKHQQYILQHQYNSQILATGALLYSISGTQSASKEISAIGWGSTLGIILLILIGFQSIRPILTELLAIISGLILAFVATHAYFGEIHIMTLVFGASLIGISIDFSFYYLFIQSFNKGEKGIAILLRLLPSILMGLITTILAYFCLFLTDFTGLQQISMFSILGLLGAWLTNFFLLPQLPALNTDLAQKLFQFIGEIRIYCLSHAKLVNIFLIVVALLSLMNLLKLHADDDIHNLQAKNINLIQQQNKIQQLFGKQALSQYFIVLGSDKKDLELREYDLLNQLKRLQQQGHISTIQAIGLVIPPKKIQLENQKLIQDIPNSVLESYAKASGLNFNQLKKWKKEVTSTDILQYDELKNVLMLSDLELKHHARLVWVDSLSLAPLLKVAQSIQQVYFVNTTAYLSKLFKEYRIKAEIHLLVAIILLFIFIMMVYRLKNAFKLMVPVVVALLASYGTLACLGYSINLFSIMPAFLILGIGIDYALYFYSNSEQKILVPISLLFCMLTSILSFGLLALSSTYAVKSFGMLVLFGVLYSYLFSFMMIQSKTDSIN